MKLQEMINNQLKVCDLTIKEAADKIGISEGRLYKITRGEVNNPTAKTILRIEAALNLPAERIIRCDDFQIKENNKSLETT